MHSYPTSQPAVLGVAAFGFATRGVFRVREGAGLARCRLCYPNSGLCYPPYAGTLILAYAGYRGGGAMVSHDENCCLCSWMKRHANIPDKAAIVRQAAIKEGKDNILPRGSNKRC